ncbi:MAG: hypothetical protein PHR16_17100 [Methylovulum sp.]|nr:hypothetical protein [Methylovulum sp.]
MKINYSTLPLIALMALTRVHHFGSAWSLPDASLAVFFLAGLCFNSRALLAVLVLEAGVIDYLAINQFNVSDWCISPAYVFLIPTYAVLWMAGRHASTKNHPLARTVALAALATSAAFVISNGSFYLFSGRYAELAALDYAAAVAQYYQPYLSSAMIYSVIGLAIIKSIKLLPATWFSHNEI